MTILAIFPGGFICVKDFIRMAVTDIGDAVGVIQNTLVDIRFNRCIYINCQDNGAAIDFTADTGLDMRPVDAVDFMEDTKIVIQGRVLFNGVVQGLAQCGLVRREYDVKCILGAFGQVFLHRHPVQGGQVGRDIERFRPAIFEEIDRCISRDRIF